MKPWLVWVPVLALLLCGCVQENPGLSTTPQTTAAQETTGPLIELYQPGSAVEKDNGGAVRAYLLEAESSGFAFMGEDILVFSCQDGSTTVTKLTGENCQVKSTAVLHGTVSPEKGNVWAGKDKLTYYSEADNSLIILDKNLRQTGNMALAETPVGPMAMTADLSTLYYGVADGIRATNVESGTSRLVRQHSSTDQGVLQCLLDDTLLMCRVEENGVSYTEFISAENGREVAADPALERLDVWGEDWFAVRTDGPVTELLYGSGEGKPRSFLPGEGVTQTFSLPEQKVAGLANMKTGLILSAYDLTQGTRYSQVELEGWKTVAAVKAAGDHIWFLGDDGANSVLCRWDTAAKPLEEAITYTAVRYTAQNPDTEGLTRCEARAKELGKQYGLKISLVQAPVEPEGYAFTYEHQVPALEQALAALETALERYPEEFYEKVNRITDNRQIAITLVRDIRRLDNMPEEDMTGLQYWHDGCAYIALAANSDTERIFYHQMCHAMDTYVQAKAMTFDVWDTLNPEGFSYDGNYSDHLFRTDTTYLEGEDRAFIDGFSMSYAREDRARVMEYAMMEGNAEIFQSEIMQAKLVSLCEGIRRGFRWTREEGTFAWEQYLHEPLVFKD